MSKQTSMLCDMVDAEANPAYGAVLFREGDWALVKDWSVNWEVYKIIDVVEIRHLCVETKIPNVGTAGICCDCGESCPDEMMGFQALVNW